MKALTSLFFIFLTTNMTFSQIKNIAVTGKIVKSEGKILDYKYFVVYKKNGKDLGYPINLRKYKTKKIESFVNKFVRIEGKISTNEFKFETQTKKTTVILAKKIKLINLSDLSIGNYTPEIKTKKKELKALKEEKLKPSSNEVVGVGFEVDDDVANATIFTGAALLIGSILLSK